MYENPNGLVTAFHVLDRGAMRRTVGLFIFVLTLTLGCVGSREPHDVATDLEGTVSDTSIGRILQDVDLSHVPLVVSVAGDDAHRYGPEDQRDLEAYLHDAAQQADGAQITVVQEVVEEHGGVISLTLNLRVRSGGDERYVPVGLELTRAGRRLLISHARVMLAR